MGQDDAGGSDDGDREPDGDAGVPDGESDQPPKVAEEIDALADEHRRLVLYYLRDRESADLAELATVISGWLQARAPDPDDVTPDDRERARIALHHVHLPRLADTGFVSYDSDAKVATFAGAADLLGAILDRALADDRRAFGRVDGGRGPGEPGGDRS